MNVGNAAPAQMPSSGFGIDSEAVSTGNTSNPVTKTSKAAFGLNADMNSTPNKPEAARQIQGPGFNSASSFGGFGAQQRAANISTGTPSMNNKTSPGQSLMTGPATPTKIGYGLQDEVFASDSRVAADTNKLSQPKFGLEDELSAKPAPSTSSATTHAPATSALAVKGVLPQASQSGVGLQQDVTISKTGSSPVVGINNERGKSSGGFGLADELDAKPKAPSSSDVSKPPEKPTLAAARALPPVAPAAPKSKGLSFGLDREDSDDDVSAKKSTSSSVLTAATSDKNGLNKTISPLKSPLGPKVLPSSTNKLRGNSDDDDDDVGNQRSALKAKSAVASAVTASPAVLVKSSLASEASKGKIGGLNAEKSKGNISGECSSPCILDT